MICKNCGAQLLEGAKFCTVCGVANEPAPVADEKTQYMFDNSAAEPQMPEAPVAPAEPVAPVYEAPVYQQPVQQAPQQPVYQAPVQQPVYQAPVQQPVYQAPVQPAPQQFVPPMGVPFGAPVSTDISEEEFFERFADKNVKSNYKASMIIAFITAALSLVLAVMGNVIGVIDIIVYAVVGGLMVKKKNWIFPLICAIWGGIGTVVGMATTGTPSGIVALVIAISATIGAKKVHDAYVEFKSTGVAPTTFIGGKNK